MGGKEQGYWMNISAQGIGVVGMLLNFATSIIVSRFFPKTPDNILDLVEDIRYPKGAGKAIRK